MSKKTKQANLELSPNAVTVLERRYLRRDKEGKVLEKPYEEDGLWNAIRKALAQDAEKRTEYQRREEIRRRLERLTPDERKVLDMIVAGRLNKVIAKEMDVSIRTVENRRREVFTKMQVRSVAELVRLAIEAGVDRPAASGDSGPPPS